MTPALDANDPYLGLDLSDPLVATAAVVAFALAVVVVGVIAHASSPWPLPPGRWFVSFALALGLAAGAVVVWDYNSNPPGDSAAAGAPSGAARAARDCAGVRGVRIDVRRPVDCAALAAAVAQVVPPRGVRPGVDYRATSDAPPYRCALSSSARGLRGSCREGRARVAVLRGPLP